MNTSILSMNLHLKNQKIIMSRKEIVCLCLNSINNQIQTHNHFYYKCQCGIIISLTLGSYFIDLMFKTLTYTYFSKLDGYKHLTYISLGEDFIQVEEMVDLENIADSKNKLDLILFYN